MKTFLPLILSVACLGMTACTAKSEASTPTKITSAAQDISCELNPEILGAVYEITTTKGTETLTVWRRGNEVAHVFQGKNITEIWFKASNGSVRPVRYFDEEKRGIEYQTADLRDLGQSVSWDALYQLVPQSNVINGKLILETGQGCEHTQTYLISDETRNVETTWLPALSLPQSQITKIGDQIITLTLKKTISNADDVNAVFAQREAYQTTDFADIGDNESDPFLLKMITLGFIEHGASGFYTAQGEAIGDGQGHNH